MESGCTPTSLGLRIGLILCILLEFTSRFHERMTISNLWWQLIIMDKMDEGNGLKTQLYWAYLMVMSSGWLGASGMQQLGPWLVTYLFQKCWFKMNTCTYFLTRGLCLRCRTPCFCSSWNITPLSENIFKLINLNFWSLLKDISWKKCKCSCSWLWISNFILVYYFLPGVFSIIYETFGFGVSLYNLVIGCFLLFFYPLKMIRVSGRRWKKYNVMELGMIAKKSTGNSLKIYQPPAIEKLLIQ